MVGGDNGESADSLDAALAPFFLVGVGILSRPSFIRLVDSDCEEDEFSSRHSLDGKFLFIDPRYDRILDLILSNVFSAAILNSSTKNNWISNPGVLPETAFRCYRKIHIGLIREFAYFFPQRATGKAVF